MTLYILIIKEKNKRNSDKAFSGCCIIMRCTFYDQMNFDFRCLLDHLGTSVTHFQYQVI